VSSRLPKDTDLRFPVNTVVSASAGSGKTYALTWRYIQLLLSEKNPHRSLKNLLAITFTNNAAQEMRERVLQYLKQICLGNRETLQKLSELVAGDSERLQQRACGLIDGILDAYSDFQVRTIDSFMATVFKASALDLGFQPEVEIVFEKDPLLDEAFELFVRELRDTRLFERLVSLLSRTRSGSRGYIWDPYALIVREVKNIYGILASQTGREISEDLSGDIDRLGGSLRLQAARVREVVERSGLKVNRFLQDDLRLVEAGNIDALIDRKRKNLGVNVPKGPVEQRAWSQWSEAITTELGKFNDLLGHYVLLHSRSYHQPFLQAIAMVRPVLEKLKRRRGQIFIEDLNRMLADGLSEDRIPDLYFKLGETIYHYLIDEFQDTSPIQWANLLPLVENALSQGGSLFVVGDTKQSIYGFRGADWTVMKRLSDGGQFPSADFVPITLDTNWRSHERIVTFAKEVFEKIVPGTDYARAGEESGLTHVYQDVSEESKGKGYVEVRLVPRDDAVRNERNDVLRIVKECSARGYRYRDMAILTPANKNVVEVSSWLNEEGIEFLSYSSLDIRSRKVVGEIIALLRFLDSPPDDLAFSTFVLGDLFGELLKKFPGSPTDAERRAWAFQGTGGAGNNRQPLYKSFQRLYPGLWTTYFERLYALVGFLPLYDLVSETYKTFRVFEASSREEAALVKLLEVVKTFEESGNNSIKDFLDVTEDEDDQTGWEIDIPTDVDAVRLMTIHKAKGLGFPVVLVLLYDGIEGATRFFFEEDPSGIRLLRITQNMIDKDDHLREVYEEQQLKDRVDGLNRLYVVFTRAKEEMYVIGVHGEERKVPSKFLPVEGYGPAAKPAVGVRGPASAERYPLLFTQKANTYLVAVGKIGFEERKRGDVIHAVLGLVEYVDEPLTGTIDAIIKTVQSDLRTLIPPWQIRATLLAFLGQKDILEYFSRRPGREIRREQELASARGKLLRADRVVIDTESVTVIDFKTGTPKKEQEYEEQLRGYMAILKEIYTKKNVVGVLAYVDGKTLKRIT
jgi:ATP-dependent helicase/nuclease subunit A